MKKVNVLVGLLLMIAMSPRVEAQHCAPIYQSFLSEISVKWVDDVMRVRVEYTKEGGASGKEAYQAYLVAYLDRDAKKVPAPKGRDVLDPQATLVLDTRLIKLDVRKKSTPECTYVLECAIRGKDLVEKVIAHMGLGEKDRDERGNWYLYRDRIRLAVFIPFLEDAKYSVLDGLPKNRHECNYTDDRALLFQTLPFRVSFDVGRRDDVKDKVWVRINGDKLEPAK